MALLGVSRLRVSADPQVLNEQKTQNLGAKVQIKKPTIFNCKIFLKEDGEKTCGARITVDVEAQQHLKVGQFWPGRVYARKWHFQEAVQQTKDKEREEAAPELAEGETTELEKTGKSSSAPVEETLQA